MDAFIMDLYRLAEYCDYKVLQGEMIRDRNDSWLVTLQLNGQPVTFKLDTGADVTVIPMGVLRRQREKTKLYPAQKRLHACMVLITRSCQ